MAYVNAGATINGMDAPSKKALKEAIAANPASVHLYDTGLYSEESANADKIREGLTYTVTGPNPYNNRKWYASVTRKGDKVTVK